MDTESFSGSSPDTDSTPTSEWVTQTLMYAALLAHNGIGVSEARIVNILNSAEIVIPLHEIQKTVTALGYIDIDSIINQPLVPEPVPVVSTEKEKPKPKEPEEEKEDEQFDLFKSLFG